MRNNFFVRTIAILLSLVTLLGLAACAMPLSVGAATTEEKPVSRLINVVYDDSNSMLESGKFWWCYAKYSLEVFSAMMQDDDMMNIYFMSDIPNGNPTPTIANLSGDRSQQQKNIETIHNKVTYTRGTPFKALEKAYGDLKKASGDYDERWMMVITDGDSFDNRETSADIDNLFKDCAGYNINVVYLAIGDALVPAHNPNRGVHVYQADGNKASGEDGILTRVTQICQKIFQRPSMNTVSGGKLTLDIPASEIIVFAQGAGASVGNLSGAKRSLASVSMTASDKKLATTNATWKDQVKADTLNACIATFTPSSGKYIPEGTYDLDIQAEEYVVYYKPALDVVLELYDSKGNKTTDKYIPIGSYSLKYWLTYPVGHQKYGEKLDQSHFGVEYSLTCTVDGVKRDLASDNVDLGGGETEIRVLARYLNFSSTDASLKYVVEDFTINEIDVDVEYNQQDYLLSTLETENEGLVVRVSRNGSPIPAPEWEPYVLKFNTENPGFKVVKNSDSTFTVYPQYSADGREATATGDIEFKITASASNDHRVTDSGTCDAKINIYDDISAVPLGVTIDEQSTDCDNKNFADQDTSRKVTIDWNGKPLTKEQYDALKLAVAIDDEDYQARIELDPYVEGEPTTATVYFDIVPDENGNPPEIKKLHGDKKFNVTASIEREGEISEGTAESELEVKDARTIWELLMEYLTLILIILLIILLLLAYLPIFKKYLPARSRYVFGRNTYMVYWYSTFAAIFTVIIPFARVRSSASLRGAGGTSFVTIKVKASGRNRAECTNRKQLIEARYNLPSNLNLNNARITKGALSVSFVTNRGRR